MNISIGAKIRELRASLGCTQTELAEALSVSPQAVSRWEIGVTYPDIELLPSIANYFGVTIDELFGCESDRETKINAIISEASKLGKYDNGRDINIEKRLTLLRNGLIEFPKNERLMHELAQTLLNAGWARIGEHINYNDEGYLVHPLDNSDNEYWQEAAKLYESLISTAKDIKIISELTYDLIVLYRSMNQSEKALALAEKAPPLQYSCELLKAKASDGQQHCEYLGKALIKLAELFIDTLIQLLVSNHSNFEDDFGFKTVSYAISTLETLFEDGNFGPLHGIMCDLYLYLSEHQWRVGLHDEAFESLDKALEHSKTIDRLSKSGKDDPKYTARLFKGISMEMESWAGQLSTTPRLEEGWPGWVMPPSHDVKAEMSADPRWEDWVRRTKG